jgi:hypothetical protein
MALHPTAEAYRRARAAGDDTTAARLMVEAHTGEYNSDLIDQFHTVGRMTRAELKAEPEQDQVRTFTRAAVVQNVYLNGSGS